jgi:hypothetical protein
MAFRGGRGGGRWGGRGGGRGAPMGPVARDDDGSILPTQNSGPPPLYPVSRRRIAPAAAAPAALRPRDLRLPSPTRSLPRPPRPRGLLATARLPHAPLQETELPKLPEVGAKEQLLLLRRHELLGYWRDSPFMLEEPKAAVQGPAQEDVARYSDRARAKVGSGRWQCTWLGCCGAAALGALACQELAPAAAGRSRWGAAGRRHPPHNPPPPCPPRPAPPAPPPGGAQARASEQHHDAGPALLPRGALLGRQAPAQQQGAARLLAAAVQATGRGCAAAWPGSVGAGRCGELGAAGFGPRRCWPRAGRPGGPAAAAATWRSAALRPLAQPLAVRLASPSPLRAPPRPPAPPPPPTPPCRPDAAGPGAASRVAR